MMMLFLPVTLLSTPLGQYVGEHVDVKIIQSVAGILVMCVALFQLWRNQELIATFLSKKGRFFVAKQPLEKQGIVGQQVEMPHVISFHDLPAQVEDDPSRAALDALAQAPWDATVQESGKSAEQKQPRESRRSIGHIKKRLSQQFAGQAKNAISSMSQTFKTRSEPPKEPVFFMIGSQRSGSNWLRTMLGQREDLAGPHPPHILREFSPILGKFGNLEDGGLKILVDHVLTFVERNQVQWQDKHGKPVRFNRDDALFAIGPKCAKLDRDANGNVDPIYYLIALLDFVMDCYAAANDKRTWICKSMGNSKYHKELLHFYTEKRLRYLYLVRDPRDVAMSFMKTPVGDCHYYSILEKWCRLQKQVIPIKQETPHLVMEVRYESLITSKENKNRVIADIFEFIGKRRFGQLLRKGSVLALEPVDELIAKSGKGKEAATAKGLSVQFQNLAKGEEFAKGQMKKWLNGKEPLSRQELQLIESVAHETMDALGYDTHVVNIDSPPTVFTDIEIADFERLNKEGIIQMNTDLMKENPEDLERRLVQSEVLGLPPTLIPKKEADLDNESEITLSSIHPFDSTRDLMPVAAARHYSWPQVQDEHTLPGYLSEAELQSRIQIQKEQSFSLGEGLEVRCAAVTQRGYYPNEAKLNQDVFVTTEIVKGEKVFYGVFDGHGTTGTECSTFARDNVVRLLRTAIVNEKNEAHSALTSAHKMTNTLLAESTIDDALSGTTAVGLYMDGLNCYVSNIGDSKAIVGTIVSDDSLSKTWFTSSSLSTSQVQCSLSIRCSCSFIRIPWLNED
jgi:hypothetical protein